MPKKIVILSTGGTIGMKQNQKSGGLVPCFSGFDLTAKLTAFTNSFSVQVEEFCNLPSPHIGPRQMFTLAQKVENLLDNDKSISGVVITHGTDTLEESAYFLDLYLKTEKPIIITGSMRSSDALSPDGDLNLFCSLQVAVSEATKNKGVLVVMNQEIHAAKDIIKTHTDNSSTFKSPLWGILGYVNSQEVVFRRKISDREYLHPPDINENVYLIKAVSGLDDFFFDCLIKKQASAIVVECLGLGNLPPLAFQGLKRAREKNIPVIISSRCLSGTVLGDYAYNGGGKEIADSGAILTKELSGIKARIKTILALGYNKGEEFLKSCF